MAKVSPGEFIRQVKLEGIKKVTWPTRRETAISTATVLGMIVVVAIFFFLVDQIFSWGVQTVLGLGH
jgi:preprotein translocase subunit SecE